MSAEGFAMFLHIMAAIVGLMMAAVLHAGLLQMRRAQTVAEMRPWPRAIHVLEPLLPAAALVLFGSGAWLIGISDGEFRWGDGWVITSIIALAVVELMGGVIAPRSRGLMRAIREAPDGPVPDGLARLRLDRPLWFMGHFGTAVFFCVIFLMAVKPSGLWPVVVVLVAAAVGLASTVPFLRPYARGTDLRAVEGRAPRAS
ncbi:MAG: DUF2269 family protein [Actinomycetota bacterium]